MFKVIRDFVEKPMIKVYCDRSCDSAAFAFLEPGEEKDRAKMAEFCADVARAGWVLNLDEHICPEHVEQDRAKKSGIVIPDLSLSSK